MYNISSDPDQRFLKWTRPNDTDPTGSRSETLDKSIKKLYICYFS